jgi:hypothetical protein
MDNLSQYSDEEIAEREALLERDLLADTGAEDELAACELCTATTRNGSLCEPCAAYDEWMGERLGSWWS